MESVTYELISFLNEKQNEYRDIDLSQMKNEVEINDHRLDDGACMDHIQLSDLGCSCS